MGEEGGEGLAGGGVDEGVAGPGIGLVDVGLGGDHVVVAGQRDGRAGMAISSAAWAVKALEPGDELVGKLRARVGVAVRA